MDNRLAQILNVLQRPLPRRPWLRWAVILAEAALPVVLVKSAMLLAPASQLQSYWIRPIAVIALIISGHALAYVVAAALQIREHAQNAIYAKRVGLTFQVPETFSAMDAEPSAGFARLMLHVSLAALIFIVAASSITYNVIHYLGWDGPFGAKARASDIGLYFFDQALKGWVFPFFEVFQISIQNKLHINPRSEWIFAGMVVLFRFVIALLTLQIFWLAFVYRRLTAQTAVTDLGKRFARELAFRASNWLSPSKR